jgi:hypothetical protein
LKRILLGSATAVLLAGLAVEAHGQSRGRFTLQPANAGRKVVQVPQTPQVAPTPLYPRYPVAYTLLPAIVMSDGSIYANFGFGYEPVSRSCGYGLQTATMGRVIAGNGVVLQSAPMPYTQPVPMQQTASQRNLPSVQAQHRSQHAHSACFSRDGSGRVFVVR